jgi:putative transposase
MRKKREYVEGTLYHVTSRTNDKIRVFGCKPGRKIMLAVLKDAKQRYEFELFNFCIMPTHIHLLIKPGSKGSLSQIMHWIKTHSAKRWNQFHGSIGHVWGNRFFMRPVQDERDYFLIMDYIDKNPVKAGLVSHANEWEPSGAFHISEGLHDLVDYRNFIRQFYIRPKLLT